MDSADEGSDSREPSPCSTIIHVSSSSDCEKEVANMRRNDSFQRTPLCPPSPTVSRPRSPRARGRSSPILPKRFSPHGKVEILVRCEELPKMDTFSSSDPICVLYIRKYGQWIEYARTECIPNCHKPQFTETLILEANNEEHHNLRFSIYDTENLTSKDLHKHQLIGSVEVELFRLLDNSSNRNGSSENNNKENHEKCFHLQFQGQAKKRGKIFIDAEQVDQSSTNTNVKLCLSAVKLSRKGLNIFGKCDAYFEIERRLYNEKYHPIYRSEVVFRTSDPRWKPFQISLQKLCNGNRESKMRIKVYNFQSKGDHTFIGYAETSFESMSKRVGDVKTLPLKKNIGASGWKSDAKRGSQDSLSKTVIRILQCVPEEQFSLVDYIKGGCKIKFSAAIDFSSSNDVEGDPLHSKSNEEENLYEEALRQIGSWFSYYDARKHYELYGFSGILDGDADHSAYFALNSNKSQKVFQIGSSSRSGLEELLYLYRLKLQRVVPSGPTFLTPLCSKILESIQPITNQDQHYTFVLILTDGVCNDMEELIKTLEKHKDDPICFVVTCIGPLRIETQYYFGVLEQNLKKKCGRSILHTVSFSDENIQHSIQMIRSSFANLSREIVQYFESRGVKPKEAISPTELNNSLKDLKDPLESFENEQKFLKEATSFCPTCGSHSSTNAPLTTIKI